MSLVKCCRLLGVTRQAYYQHFWEAEAISFEQEVILSEVRKIRILHPVIGGRKLYVLLQPVLLAHQIKMGRDALFDLLAAHYLLVRKKRRRVFTTQSFHWLKKYPNLIRELVPASANELWVADITYYRTKRGFVYISFITDAYSKKNVGYHAADTLESVHTLKALQMAIRENRILLSGLIHHSDRGVQYCSYDYVKLLQGNNIRISMTENGDPLENAVAERVNGIMKQEYLEHHLPGTPEEVMALLRISVAAYNNLRPHMSCNMLTPEAVHQNHIAVQRNWKNYYKSKKVSL